MIAAAATLAAVEVLSSTAGAGGVCAVAAGMCAGGSGFVAERGAWPTLRSVAGHATGGWIAVRAGVVGSALLVTAGVRIAIVGVAGSDSSEDLRDLRSALMRTVPSLDEWSLVLLRELRALCIE